MEARQLVVDTITALSPTSVTTSVQNPPHFPMCTQLKNFKICETQYFGGGGGRKKLLLMGDCVHFMYLTKVSV